MKGKTILLIYTFAMMVLSYISVLFVKSIDSSIAIMYAAAIGTYGARKAAEAFKDRGGKK